MKAISFVFGALTLGAISVGVSLAAVTSIGNTSNNAEHIPIYFPAGATGLTPQAQTVLDETADEAQDASVTRIIVVGYEGGAKSETNRALTASARAYAVQQGLLKRGVNPARLYAMASAAHPEADHAAPAFIADRRAEIIIERGTPGF